MNRIEDKLSESNLEQEIHGDYLVTQERKKSGRFKWICMTIYRNGTIYTGKQQRESFFK